MTTVGRHLVVLACSKDKSQAPGALPAIDRYTGPFYNVLRTFLRDSVWPQDLSVAVLSAKYGLIGGLAPIEYYDQRMDRNRALELSSISTDTLLRWSKLHGRVSLILGKDYLPALDLDKLALSSIETSISDGPIGMKLQNLHQLLRQMEQVPRPKQLTVPPDRTLFFVPDWDDMLDTEYDFDMDRFSNESKADRSEVHCVAAMQPDRMCDGVLVSLAQHLGSKGVLKKFSPTDMGALAPKPMRKRFGLSSDQWLFGDCGAFTYVNEPLPTVTNEQAVALYQNHGFDFGASVDHIPVREISIGDKKIPLSEPEQAARVKLTRDNAAAFLLLHRQRKCTFVPVGTVQGLTSASYAQQIHEYAEMGYRHVAIGGLVPRSDAEIVEIVQAIGRANKEPRRGLWIHLFGVFRPKIQVQLRHAGSTSFDSATYFRKAWLRSDQNYLAPDGSWYAAIRVPMTSDPRTRKRLLESNIPLEQLEELEQAALKAVREYGTRERSLESTLKAISTYDAILSRSTDDGKNLLEAYRRTLRARPWEQCTCAVCQSLGINIVVFRGANRNKRRGAHNTLMLYRSVSG